jgi:prepilin-type N-terminal cleavage/methylation domain-containing protein
MTSRIGDKRTTPGVERNSGKAFTLIELILVMAVLLVVLAVAAPSLSHFFRGRNLNSEARRFLSLAHYGRSRAVSEGVPMVLWMDTQKGMYGLLPSPGFTDGNTNAVDCVMSESVQMECFAPAAQNPGDFWSQGSSAPAYLSMIHFLPDGSIADSSPENILLREGEKDVIWIAKSPGRPNYEIQTNQPPLAFR